MNSPSQQFNDDLCSGARDRELARSIFPEVLHIIDFAELRELFLSYDIPAKLAKRRRSLSGFLAIGLGAVALVGAAVALWHDRDWDQWRTVALACAALGAGSLLLGWFGTLSGETKRVWLCSRLMTESLRQFHFQTLVCRLPAVLASTRNGAAQSRYIEERRGWFAEFRLRYEGHLPARLRAVLDDDAEENLWLHPDCNCDPDLSGSDASLQKVFSAYRLLRFEHQIQYANYRLGTDESIFSTSTTRQLEVLRDVALVFIVVGFVANLTLAALLGFGLLPSSWADQNGILTTAHVHLLVIGLFVGVAAMRTLEEGLQPAREVERYTRYRSTMLSLLRSFDKEVDPREKLKIMCDAERASYQEMRSFLKTHYEARYVL